MEQICCVCHRPVGPEARQLGGRCYCETHYVKVTQDRRSFWRAGALQIAGLLVFVLLVGGLVEWIEPVFAGVYLYLAGVVLALVPAAFWLTFFYQQDRLEPEPKGYVLGVFVLGGLLAQAINLPLLYDFFQVERWLGDDPLTTILGAILVIGLTQEFLKYVAVRYSVYPLPEFDQRLDGVVYGTAAGLGFATVLNVHYVVSSGGVDLQAGVIRIVVTTLAQASFSGLSGYFLGRAKFEVEPVWWLPGGVALAALLNGLFTFLRGELTTTGLSLQGGGFNPWPGLILAAVVSGVTFGLVFYLMRRANRLTLAEADIER